MACACSSMARVKVAKVDTQKVERVGTIENVNNVDFKIWRAPTVSDVGVSSAASWQDAAAIAVATLNTVTAI